MSNGSQQPEHPRDVRCEHCGRCYRNDGIHNHERNCPYDKVDGWVVPPSEWDEGDTTPSERGGDTNPPQDGDADGDQPTPSTSDAEPEPETVTDGGPRSPPTPDLEEPVDDDRDDDDDPIEASDLSDRYVAVDDYVAAVRAQAGDAVDVDALEEQLADYFVVDVQETTEETIEALTREEVAQ